MRLSREQYGVLLPKGMSGPDAQAFLDGMPPPLPKCPWCGGRAETQEITFRGKPVGRFCRSCYSALAGELHKKWFREVVSP